jgi:hypothetical protein
MCRACESRLRVARGRDVVGGFGTTCAPELMVLSTMPLLLKAAHPSPVAVATTDSCYESCGYLAQCLVPTACAVTVMVVLRIPFAAPGDHADPRHLLGYPRGGSLHCWRRGAERGTIQVHRRTRTRLGRTIDTLTGAWKRSRGGNPTRRQTEDPFEAPADCLILIPSHH